MLYQVITDSVHVRHVEGDCIEVTKGREQRFVAGGKTPIDWVLVPHK